MALLEGCGGGGGGGGGSGAPNPLITFNPSSLSATAAVNALVPDPVIVTATIANAPSDATYLGAGYTSGIVAAINVDVSQASQAKASRDNNLTNNWRCV